MRRGGNFCWRISASSRSYHSAGVRCGTSGRWHGTGSAEASPKTTGGRGRFSRPWPRRRSLAERCDAPKTSRIILARHCGSRHQNRRAYPVYIRLNFAWIGRTGFSGLESINPAYPVYIESNIVNGSTSASMASTSCTLRSTWRSASMHFSIRSRIASEPNLVAKC